MIPSAFASARLLARLNVVAVAATLAACTVAAFQAVAHVALGWGIGVPTLVLGFVWAALLRRPETVGGSTLRWGWLASLPLAALNGGLCCAGLFLSDAGSRSAGDTFTSVAGGIVLGATLGALIWGPALIATLVAFGMPIAWAQRLAAKGLAGVERGERIIGATTVTLGAAALAGMSMTTANVASFGATSTLFGSSGRIFGAALAVAGVLFGAAAFAVAALRERRRARFVAAVVAGETPHFRVDSSAEGKVLVRVETHGAGAYRVADLEEEICLLDGEGRATKMLRGLASTAPSARRS